VGGQSFFDRREVRDILAYLKVFLNPHDDISLLRIANVPARGLSDVTMQRLLAASQERKGSVFAAMQDTGVLATFQAKTRASIERFVGFVQTTRRQIQTASSHNPSALREWAEQFLDATSYFAELRRGEKDPEAAENRVRNLMEFVAGMDVQCAPGSAVTDRLQQFLEDITLDTEREKEDDTPGDAVTLITIHSCKGLEFPHVIIVGLEEGLLPHSRSKEEGTLDEERRLFYVAITRAMRTLKLSHCAARRRYGELSPCHPSQFLRELPEELIEHASDQASVPVTPEAGSAWFAAMRDGLQAASPNRPPDSQPSRSKV
ncbi:MAG TPA: ATP-dependent helicase, partial [Verrucomicrobiota bacterium]|nr:ATP-dependent helicase [Verrucomicrobiota bacterium]